MKYFLYTIIALACLVTAAVAGPNGFTVKNSTSTVITELYISPTLIDDWGNNILPTKSLKSGAEAKITFTPSAEVDLWDLKAVDNKGVATEWPGIALTDVSVVTLAFEDGEPVATYE